ncbi:hypothetical protein P43SY_008480 [Pythium insidiosum]|uniref:Uncharacterized protein n=1 Tax=Pythium insidiosum TaxID=114742 RepID=A0AAD5LT42_PYTIN|nr:hypothetical protein P43SY_008480 [Pythium insidiosum]
MTTLLMDVMSSPSGVDAAFDSSLWVNTDSGSLDIDAPLKPVSLATDEDAWLFGGEKPEISIREIQVVAADASDAMEPLKITAPDHTDDVEMTSSSCTEEDTDDDDDAATQFLLAQAMGSPVDELDAMTAFMVDLVDPFQEVVVSSDDMSAPTVAPVQLPRRKTAPTTAVSEKEMSKRLERLRAKVAHLDSMYFARAHGHPDNATRVKNVRNLERALRVASGVAQENYKLRSMTESVHECNARFLEDMSGVLNSEPMMHALRDAAVDKACSAAIMATARRAAESAATSSSASQQEMMGWTTTTNIEGAGVLSLTATKEFSAGDDFTQVVEKAWTACFEGKASVLPRVSHVVKRLSENVAVMAFDSVDSTGPICRVHRDIAAVFRVLTTSGVLIGMNSLSPAMWMNQVPRVEAVEYVSKGLRWVQFTKSGVAETEHFTVRTGLLMPCLSHAVAHREGTDAMELLLQWEQAQLHQPLPFSLVL